MKVQHAMRRPVVFALAMILVIVPAILQSAILYLKDGSELRGEVVSFEGDTLVFAPSFGGRLNIYRGDILRLVFDEADDRGPGPAAKPAEQSGSGWVSVVFKDDKVTSKIAITNKTKSRETELARANSIQQLLIVGADTVFSRVDTTTDKTVYKGHEKELKNTIRLEDMKGKVEAGVYSCRVVVRNIGAEFYEREFREGPLDLVLEYETVTVQPNRTTTLRVGISKGFMRMGRPKLVQIE
jgi:hypothetical protein